MWNFQHGMVTNEETDMTLSPNCRGESVESVRPADLWYPQSYAARKPTLRKYRVVFFIRTINQNMKSR